MFTTWKRLWDRLSNWEEWPFAGRYVFISPVWLWYCLRSGSFWFFTPSNPTLTFGGFEGEEKQEMYNLLPPGTYPNTLYTDPSEPFGQVKNRVAAAGFSYPFCVKPDVGLGGLLFRKIDSEKDWQTYHRQVPVAYMVQELILFPLEVSVFYYRYPNEQKGIISGFIQKEAMEVTGDGQCTLLELIRQHAKAKYREEEMRIKHGARLETVLPAGEKFPLAYAANLSRGGQFKDLGNLIDDDLVNVFDALSHHGTFYYGRYDLKCQSVADLKKGKNFSILEFNGSGAEPNHVIGTGYTLFGAQRVFLQHWNVLYQIARYNHKRGIRYWPFVKGWKFMRRGKKHLRLLEEWDVKIP